MNNDDPKNPTPKTPPSTGKVFDVMRPGHSPANANSRNVIVGHKPQIKDDQFVPGANSRLASGSPFDDHNLMDAAKKVDLKPSSKDKADTDTPAPATKEETPVLDQPKEDTSAKAKTTGAKPKETIAEAVDELLLPAETESTAPPLLEDLEKPEPTPATEPEKKETPVVVETTEVPDTDKKPTPEQIAVGQTVETRLDTEENNEETDSPAVDENKQQGKVMTSDELMAATNAPLLDHAVVSHHKRRMKWWEWVLVFLFIVLLAAVAVDLLLDAKVVSTGFDVPHTNFLK